LTVQTLKLVGPTKNFPTKLLAITLGESISELIKCDGIVLLDGWIEEHDCQVFADVASECGMFGWEQIEQDWYYRENFDSHAEWDDEDEEYEFYDKKGDTRFADILSQMQILHDKKQKDYGRTYDPFANVRASEDFGIPGWVGAVVRANDKMKRLQKFAQGEELVNESVEDSFLDLATYIVIAMVLFQETK
jgi:hypothetical protein